MGLQRVSFETVNILTLYDMSDRGLAIFDYYFPVEGNNKIEIAQEESPFFLNKY